MKIQMHAEKLWFISDKKSQLLVEMNRAIRAQLMNILEGGENWLGAANFLRPSVKAFGEQFIEDVRTGDRTLGIEESVVMAPIESSKASSKASSKGKRKKSKS